MQKTPQLRSSKIRKRTWLKNRKRTSKCQVFSLTVLEKPKMDRMARITGRKKIVLDPFKTVNIFVAVEGRTLLRKKFGKNLTMPKKTERGDPLVSPSIVCYAGKKRKSLLV